MKPEPGPRGRIVPLVLALLVAAVLLQAASQQATPPPAESKKEAKEEKPSRRIFTGKIALRSSRQEKETAAAGFKGVGEDGRVQKAALEAQPGDAHRQKVTQLASLQLSREELLAFLQQGSLKVRAGEKEEKKP